MAVNLSKGERVNLSKEANGRLEKIMVGLGWTAAKKGQSIDCDSSVFVLREIQKEKKGLLSKVFNKNNPNVDIGIASKDDIVYYGHLRHSSDCIKHMGDNLVGNTSGVNKDSEQILIDLKSMPQDIKALVIVVNIYNSRSRGQHFGMIENCYARIVNTSNSKEICRYNLSNDYDGKTALIVGKMIRDLNNEWHFAAVGEGTTDGSVASLAKKYGGLL